MMTIMKQTRNTLMTIYCLQLIVAGIVYILGDWMNVDMGFLSTVGNQGRFIASTMMILLTLAFIPLALRLMKFGKVAADIKGRGLAALQRWSLLRLLMIGTLLVVNTLLYYAFGFEPSFGYLAVVCLLSMPFILPTMSRCQAELEGQVEVETPEEKA